ncbi:MAG: hypothetical protein ACLPSL_08815 [Smithella sp.]
MIKNGQLWRYREGKDRATTILSIHSSTLRAMMHELSIVRPQTKEPDQSAHLPQYVEAPPNTEAKRIISYFYAVPAVNINNCY